MEASALPAPVPLRRVPLSLPLLRLRSDEQLLALFRAGDDEAFGVLVERYRQRLFAYVRQMLSAHSRQDAEDVLQDVFVRAYGALRRDERDVSVRAWLYRVAHNRCIDHLRRPVPPPAEVFEVSRTPLLDPVQEAQRRDDLKRLVEDVARLPSQQRSALLMREIDGMAYADLAEALDVTVPAVKSLLVRARVGLVQAAEARDADCAEIRRDLLATYDRGVKASSRARRHMRTCEGCREYRTALRGMRRSFAALSPAGFAPLALAAKLAGLGAGGGGAAAGGSAAAGGGGAALGAGGGLAAVTACKVAAVVCTAALATGGAAELRGLAAPHRTAPHRTARPAPPRSAPARAAVPAAPAPARPPRPVPSTTLRARAALPRLAAPVPALAKPVAPSPRTTLQAVDPASDAPAAEPTPVEATDETAAPVVDPQAVTSAPGAGTQEPPAVPVASEPQPASSGEAPAAGGQAGSAPAAGPSADAPPPAADAPAGSAPPTSH